MEHSKLDIDPIDGGCDLFYITRTGVAASAGGSFARDADLAALAHHPRRGRSGPSPPDRARRRQSDTRRRGKIISLIVTASLTTGTACIARGLTESRRLIGQILRTDHIEWETTLYVGDVEFHSSKNGPYPNHQLRVSVRPAARYAALNYIDHDDPHMPVATSFNPKRPDPDVRLIFNGSTGAVFPRAAAIPATDAHDALFEWLETRRRPTCIEWLPFETYWSAGTINSPVSTRWNSFA